MPRRRLFSIIGRCGSPSLILTFCTALSKVSRLFSHELKISSFLVRLNRLRRSFSRWSCLVSRPDWCPKLDHAHVVEASPVLPSSLRVSMQFPLVSYVGLCCHPFLILFLWCILTTSSTTARLTTVLSPFLPYLSFSLLHVWSFLSTGLLPHTHSRPWAVLGCHFW